MIDPSALMRELTDHYRMIDLSEEVRPGVLKTDGQYQWGNQVRRFELRQFVAFGSHSMHFIEAESHVGTHVELPVHIFPGRKCSAQMPLESFWGEAIVLKFDVPPAGGDGPASILPEHLTAVRPGDIVLMYSPRGGPGAPAISPEAAEGLAGLPIRMLGEQNVGVGQETHEALLGRDIPIIERLQHLEDVRRDRVFFLGLPLRVRDLESSWIRAVAFEPKE